MKWNLLFIAMGLWPHLIYSQDSKSYEDEESVPSELSTTYNRSSSSVNSEISGPPENSIRLIPAPLIIELKDSALIARLWETIRPDDPNLPPGEYQILLPTGPDIYADGEDPKGEAVLLHDGTQVGILSRSAWQLAAKASRKKTSAGWIVLDDAEKLQPPLLWSFWHFNAKTFLAWMDWPTGFTLGTKTSFSAMRTVDPQLEREFHFAWDQNIYRYFYLGVSFQRSQYGGGLTLANADFVNANLPRQNQTQSVSNSFWGNGFWTWGLSLGLPGLKYTLALANTPLPQYYWLEPSPLQVIKTHRRGQVVKQWQGITNRAALEMPGNFSHQISTKLGYLHYDFLLDGDAYRWPIHSIYFDQIHALFGTFGGGLVIASDIVATRFWLNIPDLALDFPAPENLPSIFHLTFLKVELDYRTINNFSLGFSVNLRIDNRLFKYPGVKNE